MAAQKSDRREARQDWATQRTNGLDLPSGLAKRHNGGVLLRLASNRGRSDAAVGIEPIVCGFHDRQSIPLSESGSAPHQLCEFSRAKPALGR